MIKTKNKDVELLNGPYNVKLIALARGVKQLLPKLLHILIVYIPSLIIINSCGLLWTSPALLHTTVRGYDAGSD